MDKNFTMSNKPEKFFMFSDEFHKIPIESLLNQIDSVTVPEVSAVLKNTKIKLHDFQKLISNSAQKYLEEMAQQAHNLTKQRFGATMQLYAPLYLSNYCQNQCVYCGYNASHHMPRKLLTNEEIAKEGKILKEKGFSHILLLTGESPQKAGLSYIQNAVAQLSKQFASIALEIYPMETHEYQSLIEAGADSLTIYQETYHKPTYEKVHLKGKKRDYTYRLNTPDRAGQAEFYRLNIGALLGLYDWRYEALSLANHVDYLSKRYWKTKLSISIPRIQAMGYGYIPPSPISDRELVQLICAFRLTFPDIGITLSTRESANLRDHLIPLGITAISAESQTSPGGYSGKKESEQFQVSDKRTLKQIQKLLQKKGYDPVMKDFIK